MAGGHKERKPAPKIDIAPDVEAAVIDVIHDTAARWNSQDFASLLELWDPDEAFPTYLAEEQAEWFIGWERLRGYLAPERPNPIVEAIREEMYNIKVKLIAPDLAIAVWEMHFEMKTIGSHPIGEEVRVSAVLRNTSGWLEDTCIGPNRRKPQWFTSKGCMKKMLRPAGTNTTKARNNAKRTSGTRKKTAGQ